MSDQPQHPHHPSHDWRASRRLTVGDEEIGIDDLQGEQAKRWEQELPDSVYREGLDRQSLDTSIQIVTSAERPLVIFPEGVISRSNDRLNPLMDGVSFIARVAAKKRAEQNPDRKVVIHPVALRYRLVGDLMDSIGPTLRRLEEPLA